MPGTLKWGLGIMWVGVALAGLALVIGAFALAGVAAEIGEASVEDPGVGALVGLAWAALLIGAAILILQVWALVKAGQGRRWARTLLVVLIVVGRVASVFTGELSFMTFVGIVLDVVVIALLRASESSRWFDAMSR